MTPSVKRGLQIAKYLLRQRAAADRISADFDDALAAVKWIAHQEAVDEKRRQRRKS